MIDRLLLCVSAMLMAIAVPADDEWTQAHTMALVRSVRNPPVKECWAIMKGRVKHRADGSDTMTLPIELRARFAPTRSLAQLAFNEHEIYMIGQNFADGIEGTSVIPVKSGNEGATTLKDIGIRPSDITLSFLYWEFEQDLGGDSYKAQACRILSFKHPEAGERVHVWVSTKYSFPFQVEWYRDGEDEPYRQLEFTDFKKINDAYIVTGVRVSNPGWKTMIDFKDVKMGDVAADEPAPEDLFLPTE